jgi:hypothetical protein
VRVKEHITLVLCVVLAHCGNAMQLADGAPVGPDDAMPSSDTAEAQDSGAELDGGTVSDTGVTVRDTGVVRVDVPNPSGGGDDPSTRTREQLCTRWVRDRAPGPASEWSGNLATCALGTIQPGTQEAALRILNLYRWLVGVDPTTIDPSLLDREQSCAVMMAANNALSHMPPNNWRCYQAAGAMGAGSSNLALGTGAFGSIELYINERDQNLGHRRWCLYSQLGATFFGTTGRASCMQVFQQTRRTLPAFVAYPNRGLAPIETFQSNVWHVQQAGAPFSSGNAAVTVQNMATGQMLAVSVMPLASGYGGGNAVAFSPSGWMPTVGTTYRVTVTPPGNPPMQYTTTPVRCP